MIAMLRRTDGPLAARLRPVIAASCLVAAIAACVPSPVAVAAARQRPSALPAFSSCASLLGYAQRNARRTGGATGVPTRAGALTAQVLASPGPAVAMDQALQDSAPAAPPPPAAAEAKSAPSFSSTNVQEAGVDEPDVVKTDGRRVFAIVDGRLNALDVSAGAPKLVGSLQLAGGDGHQLLIRGDRVLVMTTSYGGGDIVADAIAAPSYFRSTTVAPVNATGDRKLALAEPPEDAVMTSTRSPRISSW